MGQAIGEFLPAAVGIAVSPIPIVAVVLMLVSARARANGPAFLAGWVVGVAGLGALLLLAAGAVGSDDGGQPASWVSWLKLVLGIALLVLALGQWRGRPRAGADAPTPKWMDAVDHFTPVKAADHLEAFLKQRLPLTPNSEWQVEVDERRWIHFVRRYAAPRLQA